MANDVISVALSAVIPGLGQLYSGHFLRGLLIFAVISILVAFGWILYIPYITPLFFSVSAFLIWLWNIYDAYQLNVEDGLRNRMRARYVFNKVN
ncbi:hypothetical protein MmiHf6_08510 [Methanimicrococcus hongohii]|uniref:TM2 domain-containing protein n=1 Tax=Methanimicrococcus hongohii TaxID=3028295 RepID=A0AA96ZU85_9EURY|nr:hypothetical protein [Methanimicrococcus sp. Hf6]WNY23542.1 hypothetical protein MmiHf6_08510 [Methanimicrococcus sp. Hf6]